MKLFVDQIRVFKYSLIFALLFFISYSSNSQITFEVPFLNDTIQFSGTLTLPDTNTKHPLIILVTGSGAQTKDEEVFGFKVFKVLSDSLVKYGFGVYRYDDRGTGKSKGKFGVCNTLDFAEDANSALTELKKNKYVDTKNIGMLGHSEGGIIAPIVANKSPNSLKFIILMAGPTMNGNLLLREQMAAIFRSEKMNEEDMKLAKDAQAYSLDYCVGKMSLDSVKSLLMKIGEIQISKMDSAAKSSIKDPNKYLTKTIEAQLKQLESPWMKKFLILEPKDYLSKICDVKILALFGEKDTQVPAEFNLKYLIEFLSDYHMDEVCKGYHLSYKTIKDANHLFQKSNTGSPNEYGKLEKNFCDDFIKEIINWYNLEVKTK
jgi:pimeloyl-ACP methyl ester carboxylesterase